MLRRDLIKKSLAGLSIPVLSKAQEENIKEARAKSIIQIFLPGGMAHQDTWDYKPNGSPEYRGPFEGIKTKINDVFFGEILKNTAQISDKLTVIRSMTHGEAAHERGVHNMLTGYRPSPAIKYPSIGSIVSHELGDRNSLPAYVLVPNQFAPENGSGYLSTKYGPFALGSNPEDPNFKVKDLQTPLDIDTSRFNRRKNILQTVDDSFSSQQKSDQVKAMQSFYDNAYELMTNKNAVEAFDLSKESESIKEKYGKNSAGMRLLMARRLVEAGVRMVTVNYGGWDHHSNLKSAMLGQAPFFDKAFSYLITDLAQRGLLDSTLVVVVSEFGRTPKINSTNGRDHWPRVFSTVLAGGGIKQGFAYGTSDALAAEPDSNPVNPEDLAATVYSLLGIDFEKRLMTSDLRPIDIVREASVIKDLIA